MEVDPVQASGRLYSCLRCRKSVVICRGCDRGNVYCFGECSQLRRRESCRRASRLYQKTFKGKVKHADCQARYRVSQKSGIMEQEQEKDSPECTKEVVPQTGQGQEDLEEVTDHSSQNRAEHDWLVVRTTEPEVIEPAISESRASESASEALYFRTLQENIEKNNPQTRAAVEKLGHCGGCGQFCGPFLRLDAWQSGRQYVGKRGQRNDNIRRSRSRYPPLSLRRKVAQEHDS